MAKLIIFTLCFTVATISASLPYHSPVNTTSGIQGTKAQAPETKVVGFLGLNKYQVATIKKTLENYLDFAKSNDELANTMWDYFKSEDPTTTHLVTISKCFDYCFEGNLPSHYITIDIDRGTNRFTMVGRKQC